MIKKLTFTFLIAFLLSGCREKTLPENSGQVKWDFKNHFNTGWADSSYWDDGKAEVAQYYASQTIYKKQRSFTYTLITVSEDFNKKYNVKTDDYSRKDLFRVMKVNAFAEIKTDNYPYHFLSSLFFLRKDPTHLHKMTSSSQEWCGNTFKEFLIQDNGFQLRYHSYWDKEGDGEKMLQGNLLFEDQLIYTLRSLKFADGLSFKADVLATQISNKVGKPLVYNAEFKVSRQGDSWKVTAILDKTKINEYQFLGAYPHLLTRQLTWDNRSLRLIKSSRYAYWNN